MNSHGPAASQGSATATVAALRATFRTGRTRPLAWRRAQLDGLCRYLSDRRGLLLAALAADLGKSAAEADVTELSVTVSEARYALAHLSRWASPARARLPLWMRPASARILAEPLGVVLIISPWNYPVQLSLAPLIGALAAGNCAVIKPSELAPATAAELADGLPRYLDHDAVAVHTGPASAATALLAEHFDHIFYTGGARVARIVMTAAAGQLTPVTLELGGKCPAIVEPGCDLERAARQIVYGKFTNAGQTCVAPDHVLAIGACATALESELVRATRKFYGAHPERSRDYGRIVNATHLDRLAALLGDGRILIGGGVDRAARYIAPTVMTDITPGSPLLTEEIFGPILPIIPVGDLSEAIDTVNSGGKPLAIYAFTRSGDTIHRLSTETSSGALVTGPPLVHLAAPELPFGGVGASGIGAYHGEASFRLFSHAKPILTTSSVTPDPLRLVYPPAGALRRGLVRRLLSPHR